jgi:flagellar motor switch protein FliM
VGQEVQELKPTVVGHENNSRFLQTTGSDTPMLSLVLQARFNEDSEQLQMVFPYYTVEPFVRHLNPFSGPVQELPPAQVRWNPQMNEVPVALTARCEGLKVTARQMSRLQAGDTLMLSRETAGEVRVCLGGVPKFAGRLGTCGRKWAVELSALAHP